jgi:hypothetical protein
MATCVLIAPRRNLNSLPILNDNLKEKLNEAGCSQAIVFSAQPIDSSQELSSELEDLGLDVVGRFELPTLTTEGLNNESALRMIPWKILEEIVSTVSSVDSSIFVIGRGARLHDHLFWLAANCLDAEIIHADSEQPFWHFNPHGNIISTEIAQNLLASILKLMSKATINNESETIWFGAEEIAKLGSVMSSGVNSATQTAVTKGLVEKQTAEDRVVYRLTSKGWPIALKTWMQHRNQNDETINKRLAISFGRLPPVKVTELETGQGHRAPFAMVQYLKNLQPFDGLIAILQRMDDSIEGTHVMTLEEALNRKEFESSSFIGDLRYADEILRRRSEEELTNYCDHLFVLNPKASSETDQLIFNSLWSSITKYEDKYGQHNWTIDLTSPFATVSETASMFAYNSDSEISYVMKSRKGSGPSEVEVEDSPFSSADHRLILPGKLAVETLSGLNPTEKSIMLAMLLYEDSRSIAESHDINDEFDDFLELLDNVVEDDSTVEEGVSWKELTTFVKETLKTPEKLKLTNQSRIKPLINSNLITVLGSSGARHFALTSLGRFVAIWLKSLYPLEALS